MDAANIYTSKSYARQPKITLHSGFIENHNYHRSKRFTCIAAIDQESTPSALPGRVRRERGSKEPGMQCSAVTVPFSPACSSCTHPPDPSTAPSTAPRTEHSSVLCVSPARLPGTEGKLNRLPTPRTDYKPLCQTDTTQSISLLPSLNRTVACPAPGDEPVHLSTHCCLWLLTALPRCWCSELAPTQPTWAPSPHRVQPCMLTLRLLGGSLSTVLLPPT